MEWARSFLAQTRGQHGASQGSGGSQGVRAPHRIPKGKEHVPCPISGMFLSAPAQKPEEVVVEDNPAKQAQRELEADPDILAEGQVMKQRQDAHSQPDLFTFAAGLGRGTPVLKTPAGYDFLPLNVSGGAHRPTRATRQLVEKIGGIPTLQRFTELFYQKCFVNSHLDQFIANHSEPHGQRFAYWIAEKFGAGTPWTDERRTRPTKTLRVDGEAVQVSHDRSSSHFAAWFSPKRAPEKRGQHFLPEDARVWMRLHFWAARETGLFDRHPAFMDYYVRFIGHFVSVYSSKSPPFARESARWSASPEAVGRYEASNWEKFYSNPCEALCARRSWCSGYGYSFIPSGKYVKGKTDAQRKNQRVPGREICTLFDKGTGLCTGRHVVLQGLLPVHSARDLVFKPAGDIFMRTNKNGVDIRLKYLSRRPDSAYICKAKTPVYLDEVRVLKMPLALMDSDSVWENRCEKLCSMFSWCSGYAYREKAENLDEACGLYTKQKDPAKSDQAWVIGTKPKAAHEPGQMSTHFVRDPEQPGFICKAKMYATKWRTSAGAAINCKSNFAGILKSSVMMILNILYASQCDSIASSNSDSATTTTTTVAANSSSNDSLRLASHMDSMGSFDPVQLTRLASHMDSMGSLDPVQLTRLFPPESRVAAENFTFGASQARTAVAELLRDSDEDARAIAKLRSKRSRSSIALRCKFAFTGQVFRFFLFSLATSVSNIYQCKMLHKERYRCEADLLRVAGGLFGSLMYGYPRITLECGSLTWPPTTLTCAGDFAKSIMFFGKTIWTIIQTYYFVDEDKDIEKWAGGIDTFASLGFIAEGILRALGPCLGHLSGDDSKVVLPNGACLGTYTEVSALSVQTLSYSVLSYTQCRDWYRAGAHQK